MNDQPAQFIKSSRLPLNRLSEPEEQTITLGEYLRAAKAHRDWPFVAPHRKVPGQGY